MSVFGVDTSMRRTTSIAVASRVGFATTSTRGVIAVDPNTFEVTPTTVAINLSHLARELASLTDGLGDLERHAVEKREDYIMAHAKAYLTSGALDAGGKPPPAAVREAKSNLATHDERLAAETADALVRQRKAQIGAIKVRIDVGRSVGSIVKSEIELGKVR